MSGHICPRSNPSQGSYLTWSKSQCPPLGPWAPNDQPISPICPHPLPVPLAHSLQTQGPSPCVLSTHWMKFNLRALALAVPSGSHTTQSLNLFQVEAILHSFSLFIVCFPKRAGNLACLTHSSISSDNTRPGTGQLLTKYLWN